MPGRLPLPRPSGPLPTAALRNETPMMITASGTAVMFVLTAPSTMQQGCDNDNPLVSPRPDPHTPDHRRPIPQPSNRPDSHCCRHRSPWSLPAGRSAAGPGSAGGSDGPGPAVFSSRVDPSHRPGRTISLLGSSGTRASR